MKLASIRSGGVSRPVSIKGDQIRLILDPSDFSSLVRESASSWQEIDNLSQAEFGPPVTGACQILYASAYPGGNTRSGAKAAVQKSELLMYQGDSSYFLGPNDNVSLGETEWGLDFEPEIGVILSDVPMGTGHKDALNFIRYVGLINDWTYRSIVAHERTNGFGFIQGKPASAWAPFLLDVRASPAWQNGVLVSSIKIHLNGKVFGVAHTAESMQFNFGELIAHAALTRRLPAGTIISSGTVSPARSGASTLVEYNVMRTNQTKILLKVGDEISLEAFDDDGVSLFGAIKQRVV